MDSDRFDSLTRSLFVAGSRRTVSRALACLGVGTVLAPLTRVRDAGAKGGHNNKHNNNKKKKHKRAGQCPLGYSPCGQGCCPPTTYCDPGTGSCFECRGGPDYTPCGGALCCRSDQTCCNGACCQTALGETCCGNTICCPTGFTCAGEEAGTPKCCPPDQPACGFICCQPGTKCCYAAGDARCIGQDECCPSVTATAAAPCDAVCCPQGTVCNTDPHGLASCCVPGRIHCGGRCCSEDAGECCFTTLGEAYCCTQGSHCKPTTGHTCV